METWGITTPKKEKDITGNAFGDYQVKKKKGPTSPESEQRELIAKLIDRPFRQVAGLTKGWTLNELYLLRRRAESFSKNPMALMWKLMKEKNLEIKKQLKNAESKTKSIK